MELGTVLNLDLFVEEMKIGQCDDDTKGAGLCDACIQDHNVHMLVTIMCCIIFWKYSFGMQGHGTFSLYSHIMTVYAYTTVSLCFLSSNVRKTAFSGSVRKQPKNEA